MEFTIGKGLRKSAREKKVNLLSTDDTKRHDGNS